MKKYLLISISLFGICFSKAQIGINTANPKGVLHINTNSGSSINKDVIITEEGKIGIGNLNPISSVDTRSKDSYNSAIAVGNTSQSASSTGVGAIRWNNSNLQYSNGVDWVDVPIVTPKAFVTAEKETNQIVNYSLTTDTPIIEWTKIKDITDSFNPLTGIFTANKDGIFIVTFSFEFSPSIVDDNAYVETILESNRTNNNIEKYRCVSSYPGKPQKSIIISGMCTGVFNLLKGDIIKPMIKNVTGSNIDLSTDNTKNKLTIIGL